MQPPKPHIELDLGRSMKSRRARTALDFPRTAISDVLEAVIEFFGGIVNWIWIVLVLVIVANVVGSYVFAVNYIWVEEVQWHMYAVGFMLGIGYALKHDAPRPCRRAGDEPARQDPRLDRASRHSAARRAGGLRDPALRHPLRRSLVAAGRDVVGTRWSEQPLGDQGGNRRRLRLSGARGVARLLRVCAFLFGFPRRAQPPEFLDQPTEHAPGPAPAQRERNPCWRPTKSW
jgi:hypothetical protein